MPSQYILPIINLVFIYLSLMFNVYVILLEVLSFNTIYTSLIASENFIKKLKTIYNIKSIHFFFGTRAIDTYYILCPLLFNINHYIPLQNIWNKKVDRIFSKI